MKITRCFLFFMVASIIQPFENIAGKCSESAWITKLGSGNNAVSAANQLFGMLRHKLALTAQKALEDDIKFNMEILDKYINQDYDENNPFKLMIEKEHNDWKDYIHFSKKGFQCNERFCKKYGDGVYGFGICTPYYCTCSISGPESSKCEGDLVFDPVYESCDIPTKIKICGL